MITKLAGNSEPCIKTKDSLTSSQESAPGSYNVTAEYSTHHNTAPSQFCPLYIYFQWVFITLLCHSNQARA